MGSLRVLRFVIFVGLLVVCRRLFIFLFVLLFMVRKFNAVKALICRGDEYLFVESKDFEGGRFEIPGGRKDDGESDEVALLREVKEEVALVVKVVRLLDEWTLDLPAKDLVLDGKTYLCEYVSGEVCLGDEQDSFCWVSVKDIPGLDVSEWLRRSISCL